MERLTKEQGAMSEMALVTKDRLWNWNFFLLWQGHLVSAFGDRIYDIALGFWVLAVTGSTALMGFLVAAATLPRVFISPFSGTFADRHDRRKILIYTDLIRGIVITTIGIMAILGLLEPWMVLLAGIVSGICGAFFNPAVLSSLPELVPTSKLIKANSVFSLVGTATGIMGNVVGGFLFQILGAPVLFLFNGLSFLFSAVSEIFIKMPVVIRQTARLNFWEDMRSGFHFINRFVGLKWLYVTIAILNFCTSMGMTLIMPLFQHVETLGPDLYGVAMAFSTGGIFVGFLLLSMVDIGDRKYACFVLNGLVSALAMMGLPFLRSFPLMAGLFFLNGACVAASNAMLQASMQLIVPPELRGKVFGFRRTLSSALIPLGMVLGGVLAEFIQVQWIICGSYTVLFVVFVRLVFSRKVRKVFLYNPATHDLQDFYR